MNAAPATLTLDNTVLVLKSRKFFPSTSKVDLRQVVRIWTDQARYQTSYSMVLVDSAGKSFWLNLKSFRREDKLALRPAIDALLARADVQKDEKDITKALDSWYKY